MKYIKSDYEDYIMSMVQKDYSIVDPPWVYEDKPTKVRTQLDYGLWDNNIEEMKFIFTNLKSNILFLWTTNVMIEEVFYAMYELKKTASFTWNYKTFVTWIKHSKKNKEAWLLGRTYRNVTEHLMVFTKNIPALKIQKRNIIKAACGARTLKPKQWERNLLFDLRMRKYMSGCYIFCGPEINHFHDFDIECVDIIDMKVPKMNSILRFGSDTT